jgi:hypothetical protein
VTTYIVSPAEKPETWSMPNDAFVTDLRRRWPDVEVTPVEDPSRFHGIEWRIQVGERKVEGALSRDGRALILEGDIEDVADIAVWFRSLVPEGQPLLFYDEGYNVDVPLSQKTEASEIVRAFVVV